MCASILYAVRAGRHQHFAMSSVLLPHLLAMF
eukprot:SAG11_NODE_35743_length_265_cov_0.626506_1_plen_31_part_01